jgi:phage tail sheath protein FI
MLVGIAAVTVAAVARKYLTPGVYVEEVPSSPRPIEGVGTSTAGRVSDEADKP